MFFRLESPWAILLLLLVPLLTAWHLLAKQLTAPAGLRFADTHQVKIARRGWRTSLQHLLLALRLAALALLVLALARPQAGVTRQTITGEGVTIALALDISGSMASLDFQPKNRLEAAKTVIHDFIELRPYDQIGLVVFAGSAFHQSPPTIDRNVLLRLLNQIQLSTDLGIEDSTALGMGLANAAGMLKDIPTKSKVVILLTDGVNNTGQIDPLTAANAAKSLGIKVYTIGMGRPGQVPVPGRDAFGMPQVSYRQSELDEATLQTIAEMTGGLYFRAEDTSGLQKVYAEINRLEKSQYQVESYTRYQELAAWVLVPALTLLLLEIVLSRTLFRRIP